MKRKGKVLGLQESVEKVQGIKNVVQSNLTYKDTIKSVKKHLKNTIITISKENWKDIEKATETIHASFDYWIMKIIINHSHVHHSFIQDVLEHQSAHKGNPVIRNSSFILENMQDCAYIDRNTLVLVAHNLINTHSLPYNASTYTTIEKMQASVLEYIWKHQAFEEANLRKREDFINLSKKTVKFFGFPKFFTTMVQKLDTLQLTEEEWKSISQQQSRYTYDSRRFNFLSSCIHACHLSASTFDTLWKAAKISQNIFDNIDVIYPHNIDHLKRYVTVDRVQAMLAEDQRVGNSKVKPYILWLTAYQDELPTEFIQQRFLSSSSKIKEAAVEIAKKQGWLQSGDLDIILRKSNNKKTTQFMDRVIQERNHLLFKESEEFCQETDDFPQPFL